MEGYKELKEKLPFGPSHSKRLANWVNERIFKKETNDLLLIHCFFGIHRSGAIGFFLAKNLGINMTEFNYINPEIDPSRWVLSVLESCKSYFNFKENIKNVGFTY